MAPRRTLTRHPFLTVELDGVDLVRGERTVLQGVSWRIQPNERWALLGRNGAGKTQLMKILAGDVWPAPGSRRTYRLGRQVHAQPLGVKELIAYVGAERQDRYARYDWNLAVADLVATGLFATDIPLHQPTSAQRRRVQSLLASLGLKALSHRRMLTLSYGEQRLALIARALVSKPRLLLLDEVFNGLDRARRDTLMRYLERSARARLPWVLAIHRREDLPRSVTHLLVLEQGTVRYRGRLTQPTVREFFGPEAGRPSQQAVARVARRRRERLPVGLSAGNGLPRIRISRADVYVEHHRVLREVDWEIRDGEHWAIVGGNGSGKSTLLKLLHGEIFPALGGIIERAGFPRGTPLEDFRRTVGWLSPQLQSDHARDDLTVEDIVISGRYASVGLNDSPTAADRRAARRVLRASGLEEFASRKPRELSYGQMRRVLLARATVHEPQLLLLDEPCTGLDARSRHSVLQHLEQLASAGTQVIMATHHVSDLIPSINRVLRLRQGRARAEERRDTPARARAGSLQGGLST